MLCLSFTTPLAFLAEQCILLYDRDSFLDIFTTPLQEHSLCESQSFPLLFAAKCILFQKKKVNIIGSINQDKPV